MIPRNEIDALWKVFALFSNPKYGTTSVNTVASSDGYTLKILRKMFYSNAGVFGRPLESEKVHPPCTEQLLTCCREFDHLSLLIDANFFDTKNDHFIHSLIADGFSLLAERNICSNIEKRLLWDDDDKDVKIVSNLWETSDFLRRSSDFLAEFDYSLVSTQDDFTSMREVLSFMPYFQIVISSCKLIQSSMKSCVKGKARWNRMAISIQKLVCDLVKGADRREEEASKKNGTQHDILGHFGPVELGKESDQNDHLAGAAGFRQGAGYIMVTAALARTKFNEKLGPDKSFLVKVCTLQIC